MSATANPNGTRFVACRDRPILRCRPKARRKRLPWHRQWRNWRLTSHNFGPAPRTSDRVPAGLPECPAGCQAARGQCWRLDRPSDCRHHRRGCRGLSRLARRNFCTPRGRTLAGLLPAHRHCGPERVRDGQEAAGGLPRRGHSSATSNPAGTRTEANHPRGTGEPDHPCQQAGRDRNAPRSFQLCSGRAGA